MLQSAQAAQKLADDVSLAVASAAVFLGGTRPGLRRGRRPATRPGGRRARLGLDEDPTDNRRKVEVSWSCIARTANRQWINELDDRSRPLARIDQQVILLLDGSQADAGLGSHVAGA